MRNTSVCAHLSSHDVEASRRHELDEVVHQLVLPVFHLSYVGRGCSHTGRERLVLGSQAEIEEVLLEVAPQSHEPAQASAHV